MATVYGNWATSKVSGNHRYRLYAVISQTVTGVDISGSVKLYLESSGKWSMYTDNQWITRLSTDGPVIGVAKPTIWRSFSAPRGSKLLLTRGFRYKLTNSEVKRSISAKFEVANDAVAQLSTQLVCPPAGSVALFAPPTPSEPTVSSNGETGVTVSFTIEATTNAPVDSYEVVREEKGGERKTVFSDKNLRLTSILPKSISDSVSLGKAYRWVVIARNSVGSRQSVSGWFRTAPASSVKNIELKRDGKELYGTWDIAGITDADALEMEVQYQKDSGHAKWSSSGLISLGDRSERFTPQPGEENESVRIRVRTVALISDGANKYGPWVYSDWVQPPAPPGPPLMLAPSGVYEVGTTVEARWQHNPVDGSPQGKWELSVISPNAESTSLSGVGQESTAKFTLDSVGMWQVMARTATQSLKMGPWSSVQAVYAAQRPTITITSPTPDSPYSKSQLTLNIEYSSSDGSPMAAWTAELRRDGVVIETKTGVGQATSVTFDTILIDGATYGAVVEVQSGYGLTGSDSIDGVAVGLEYPHPVPIVSTLWSDESGTVSLMLGEVQPVTPLLSSYLRPESMTGPLPDWGLILDSSIIPPETKTEVTTTSETTTSGRYSSRGVYLGGMPSDSYVEVHLGLDGQPYPVWPGAEITLQAAVWGSADHEIFASWLDENFDHIVNTSPIMTQVEDGVWGVMSGTVTAPDGAAWLDLKVISTPLAGGDTKSLSLHWLHLSYRSGSVDSVGAYIERSLDGVHWVRISELLPPGSPFDDQEAPLSSDVHYRSVSASADGVEYAGQPVLVNTESETGWITADGASVAVRYNQSYESTASADSVLVQYLGHSKPTAHFGTTRPVSVSVSTALKGYEEREKFEAMLGKRVYYRDPVGRAFRAVIGDISASNDSPYSTSLSFTVTEVRDGDMDSGAAR